MIRRFHCLGSVKADVSLRGKGMLCAFITSPFKGRNPNLAMPALYWTKPAAFPTISKEIDIEIEFHSLPALCCQHREARSPHAPGKVLDPCDVHAAGSSVLETMETLAHQLRKFPSFQASELFHVQIYKRGFLSDMFMCNSLVLGYRSVGDLVSAHILFDGMPMRNSVTWSIMISGYVQNNIPWKAWHLFRDILVSGSMPNTFSFGSILRACQDQGSSGLMAGIQIHAQAWKLGLESDATVCNALISMYGSSSSSPASAFLVFEGMEIKEAISWNSVISLCSRMGDASLCFKLFSLMQNELCCRPSEYTFCSLVAAAPCCSCMENGMFLLEQMLGRVSKSGFLQDVYVCSSLVSSFARFSPTDYAMQLFDQMGGKSAVSMNGLLVGLISQGCGEDAVEVFRKKELVDVNCDTYAVLLCAFCELNVPEEGRDKGKEVHGRVIRAGLIDVKPAVGNGLINMYAKCGAIRNACSVFTTMLRRDSVSWNSIISGLDQHECFEDAVNGFNGMRREGLKSSNFALISALSSGASLGWISTGEQLHCEVIKQGLDSDVSVLNAVLALYSEAQSHVRSCRKVFASMPSLDEISWNSMIGASESVECYVEMLRCGWVPNRVTFINTLSSVRHLEAARQVHASALKHDLASDVSLGNALISCYGRCGAAMEEREKVFGRLTGNDDRVCWNSMISGYVQDEQPRKAMGLVWEMTRTGERLDAFAHATVLSACAALPALHPGMEVHACTVRACLEFDVVVGSAVVDMYGKCGRMEYASRAFEGMGVRNAHSWNSVISGHARHGGGRDALEVFARMKAEGPRPDAVTFLAVLSACTHSGLLEEALLHFDSMAREHHVIPRVEHYCCIVDLLARKGGDPFRLEKLLDGMPVRPTVLVWRTVLAACGLATAVGRRAARMAVELEPENPSNYVLLSNMHAARSDWDGVAEARRVMWESAARKEAGCSWVAMRDGIHVFTAGDASHPDTHLIAENLAHLHAGMKDFGPE